MLQIQDQSLRHVATAHLAQTMSLLALSNQELPDKVLEELAERCHTTRGARACAELSLFDDIADAECHAAESRRKSAAA